MTLSYNGVEIGNIITNRGLTIEEALYSIGYDVKNEDDLKKAYEDNFLAAYQDDNGFFQIDIEGISMEY